MTVSYFSGNIAESSAPIICNTVNCIGVAGKGVALAIRERFPEFLERYKHVCREGLLHPGGIMISRTNDGRTIVNLATKLKWRNPSRYEWAGGALFHLNRWLEAKKVAPCRIALPMPGAGEGGLDPAVVQGMIRTWLAPAIAKGFEIEVYADELNPQPGPVFYAGVGARDTPKAVLEVMTEFGELAAGQGWVLRSGGAVGADSAFHSGARKAGASSEIFVGQPSKQGGEKIFGTRDVHYRIMRHIHPAPDALNDFTAELQARNGCQIYGSDFVNPSRVTVCWTKDGKEIKGTGQAIRLSRAAGIPVLNLGSPRHADITASDAFNIAKDMVAGREFLLGMNRQEDVPESAWV